MGVENMLSRKFENFVLKGHMRFRLSLVCLFFAGIFLCSATSNARKDESGDHVVENEISSLALIGFNYTNKDIDSYSVNGVGGGDIRLSSSTSGGGGITCCIDLSSLRDRNGTVKIRWQVDGCMYILANKVTGGSQKIRHLYYKEQVVGVKDISKGHPRYIETHFHQSGKVQVLLTQEISNPLLQLDDNRPDQSFFSRCKDDKRPE